MINYLKDKQCVRCGEDDPRVFDMDHINPDLKNYNITFIVQTGMSLSFLKKELKNCQVLCANCHRIKTYEERGLTKFDELIKHKKKSKKSNN